MKERRTRAEMLKVLALVGVLAMAAFGAKAEPLAAYQWSERPLLVFGTGQGGGALSDQVARLEAAAAGLRERDMAVLVVEDAAERPRALVGTAPRGVTGAALRETYGVAPGAFAVILIGKDGLQKNRWDAVVAPATVFAQIDSMPMRMREMREGS